jgi:hypothetical protein
MNVFAAVAGIWSRRERYPKSLGRYMTCDSAYPVKTKKPFIVDLEAPFLKRNPKQGNDEQLSKDGRTVYVALRALANGRTGELKIGGNWLKATVIDAAAEMCRDLRMKAIRELQAFGLVTVRRVRRVRMIKERRRTVLAECQYIVHKTPIKNACGSSTSPANVGPVLLESISSTVDRIDSQYYSKHLQAGAALDSENSNNRESRISRSSSPNEAKRDELFSANYLLDRLHQIRNAAREKLIRHGLDAAFVDESLDFIDENAEISASVPNSPAYYIAGVQRLSPSDTEKLWSAVNLKKCAGKND